MPSLEDARFNSRARAEQRKKAKALDPSHLVKVILAHKTESLADTSQMRDGWSNDWRLFQGEVDFSDKEDWQSQVWEPKSWAAIMQAQTIIQNSLLESADFFGISGTDQKSKVLADLFFKPLITLAFDKCHLVQKFTDSVCALQLDLFRFKLGQACFKSGDLFPRTINALIDPAHFGLKGTLRDFKCVDLLIDLL